MNVFFSEHFFVSDEAEDEVRPESFTTMVRARGQESAVVEEEELRACLQRWKQASTSKQLPPTFVGPSLEQVCHMSEDLAYWLVHVKVSIVNSHYMFTRLTIIFQLYSETARRQRLRS